MKLFSNCWWLLLLWAFWLLWQMLLTEHRRRLGLCREEQVTSVTQF